MSKTTIGKLREMLVLETELDGKKAIHVIPKGYIIEISGSDEWPDSSTDLDLKEAVKYLKENE